MVEVTGIEPATSWSQTTRATNCATPRFIKLSLKEEFGEPETTRTSDPRLRRPLLYPAELPVHSL